MIADTPEDGHQWFPDIASDGETLTVIYYDSVGDPGYAPDVPPGNDADGVNSGDVVNAFVAESPDGLAWTPTQVSSAGSNFGWETHGSRRVGFWGDYLYVSAVPGAVNVVWTDSRDLVSGTRSARGGRGPGRRGWVRRVPGRLRLRPERHQRTVVLVAHARR